MAQEEIQMNAPTVIQPRLCLTPESELPKMDNECVFYRDGAKIDAVWTRWRFAEICWLMLNNNDQKFFFKLIRMRTAKRNSKKTKRRGRINGLSGGGIPSPAKQRCLLALGFIRPI